MASKRPSEWAEMEAAMLIFNPNLTLAIATALDAAREQGRREREAEIVGWLRTAAAECGAYSGNSFVIAADKIERGAGRKEDTDADPPK